MPNTTDEKWERSATLACLVFIPTRTITTGEGGAVVTNNSELAAKIRKLRNQGRDESDAWFQHSELGYNYRISDINCALGIEQLNRIDSILDSTGGYRARIQSEVGSAYKIWNSRR